MEEAAKAMASDESGDGYGYDYHHLDQHHGHTPQGQYLSRLSVGSSSFTCGDDEVDKFGDGYYGDMEMHISRLSMESFDVNEELSDDQKTLLTSDSGGERECYPLPVTPARRYRGMSQGLKDYASKNEAWARMVADKQRKSNRARRRSGRREGNYWNGVNGESEGGCGLMVITRPKGGRQSLCMDLEEVKACRELGFELEHERMLEVPSKLSFSGSNLDTNSSGGNSPITNWSITIPGDDPRDVKSRLKVWAQAVALVSVSQSMQCL